MAARAARAPAAWAEFIADEGLDCALTRRGKGDARLGEVGEAAAAVAAAGEGRRWVGLLVMDIGEDDMEEDVADPGREETARTKRVGDSGVTADDTVCWSEALALSNLVICSRTDALRG